MAAKGNVAAAAALVIICNMYGCAPGANESQPSNPEPSPSGEYAALQGDYSFQERASKWTDADGEDVTDSTVAMYSGERGGEHTV